jgi:hypothetical protein
MAQKIRNVSPYGDLDVPLLGVVVLAGETVDVTDEQAKNLLAQAENWAPVTVAAPSKSEEGTK